ncbi:MAG: polymerase, sigma-24 subunit, subfamily [Clostridia bacterium]|jgi:RNA polymerase sigma-70 factor (ECF subfamily)|nr:polymerase, sigma-24 subunit, subfamily [Clostridia bacterium]
MEEEIVELLQERKPQGIDYLMDVYGHLIYGVIYNTAYHQMKREDMEECYNDVIFIIWSKINQYDPQKGTFKNWMIAIVKFRTIDYIRKYKKLQQENSEEKDVENQSAEEIFMSRESHQVLKRAIQELEKTDQQIFQWRYIEDLSIEAISSRLKMTPQALYTRISRGKKRLRKWMEGECHDKKE